MISDELNKKARLGRFVRQSDYIQIPLLNYHSKSELNENPYILLTDIQEELRRFQGKAGEEEYWRRIEEKFNKGSVAGASADNYYEFKGNTAMVRASKEYATHKFWISCEGGLTDEELDWLEENSEQYELCVDGMHAVAEIYVMPMDTVLKYS